MVTPPATRPRSATVGGKLQQPDTCGAVKGGAGLLIDSVSREMAGLSGNGDGKPAVKQNQSAVAAT